MSVCTKNVTKTARIMQKSCTFRAMNDSSPHVKAKSFIAEPPNNHASLSHIWQIQLRSKTVQPGSPQWTFCCPSPVGSALLKLKSTLETWALFSSLSYGCAYSTCAGPLHTLSLRPIACLFFTHALPQPGNYSARIHQAHFLMRFMRNNWDKTSCKCVWIWGLH